MNHEATSLTRVSGAGQPSAATPSDPPPPSSVLMFIPKTEPGIYMSKKTKSKVSAPSQSKRQCTAATSNLKRLLSDGCLAGSPPDLHLLLDRLKNMSLSLQICKMVMLPRLLRLSFCPGIKRTVGFSLLVTVSTLSSSFLRDFLQ